MTKFRMVGGLGNQLFIASAADALATASGRNVVLDFSEVSANLNSHGNSSAELLAPYFKTIGTKPRNGKLASIREGVVTRIIERLPKQIVYRQDQSEVGFDPDLLALSERVPMVRGYFQSHKYLELGSDLVRRAIRSRAPSSLWAQLLIERADTHRILGVHARRGDYWAAQNRIGVLDVTAWLLDMRLFTDFDETWVFSDDEMAAAQIAKQIGCSARAISKPDGVSDLDVLQVMSHCTSLMISNSSFSWWAAVTGAKERVFYPSPWFRDLPDPTGLVPESWVALKSNWMQSRPS